MDETLSPREIIETKYIHEILRKTWMERMIFSFLVSPRAVMEHDFIFSSLCTTGIFLRPQALFIIEFQIWVLRRKEN